MKDLYNTSLEYKEAEEVMTLMLKTGEITQQIFNDSMSAVSERADELIEDSCKAIKNREMYISALTFRLKEIEEKAKHIKNKISALESYNSYSINFIEEALKRINKEKIDFEDFSVKYKKKRAQVLIINEELIPDEFIKTKEVKEIKKNDCYLKLMNNEEIPGVKLGSNKKLVIK